MLAKPNKCYIILFCNFHPESSGWLMISHILVHAFLLAIHFLSRHSSLYISSYFGLMESVLILLRLPCLWNQPDKLRISQICSLRDLHAALCVCVQMATVVHDWSLCSARQELERVLVLLLFWSDVISELNQKTHVSRPGSFPALYVKQKCT